MPISGPKHCSILLSSLFFFSLIHFVRCADDEIRTLLDLKSGLQSADETLFDTWREDSSPCNFVGVTCNSMGSVTEIDLTSRGISGWLRVDSVCKLPSLQKLSMANNFLSGNFQSDLRNCSDLLHLDLASNGLYGTVPDLSSLTKLQVLNLSLNGFTGPFPWSSLKGLGDLTELILGDNRFDKTSFPAEILGLKKLSSIYLSNCSFEGKIPPAIGELTELVRLELSTNNMSGEIPEELTRLTKLRTLELYENQFTGTLPNGFSNLFNLESFDASTNQLEGDLQQLKNLTKLISLQLLNNRFTGEVPDELGEFRALVNLSLYSNKLSGSLPQKLGCWAEFNFIDVSSNNLTGTIPPNMCKRGTMTRLLMLDNQFTGQIPASYATCRTLIRFRLSNNKLSGTVPAKLWGLPKAEVIDLSGNDFEGPVTSDIQNAKTLSLLVIAYNRFSGQLPPQISGATSLVFIDARSNQLSGEVPPEIGELKNLNGLYLQKNMLTGKIPEELASCVSLNEINLSDNSLSGDIPASLSSLRSLNSLNLSNNHLSGHITASLSTMRLSLLDLSNNRLSGPIPQALQVGAYERSFDGNPDLCSTTESRFRPCRSNSGKSHELRTLLSCFLAGLVVLVACVACYIYSKKRKSYLKRLLKEDSWDLKSFQVLTFTEREILNAMKQENLIGKGGFGNVYKVVPANGKELAVKHIWNMKPNGLKSSSPMLRKRPAKSSELDAEVATLSSIRHVNLVKLYCSITSEDSSLLVYEYLPNGSLWDRMHTSGKVELDWMTRYGIAIGAAKGLEYLHHGCERPIIHRDVKSSNILLDEFFKPRIADFGLAKIVQSNNCEDSTHVIAGTHGYIAPEYGYTYKVNEKSDVYSFGVVLMELVTGKKPIEPEFGENKDLVWWISSRMSSRDSIMGVVDARIPEPERKDAVKMLRVAVLCTARLPALRPSMRTVVQMLEEAEPSKSVNIVVKEEEKEAEMEKTMSPVRH
ncbi:receptor-like protein kinase 7 [Aristolochia californica]|uniref:receptor-like protein kinase 7 n=1 Tax=Aristolochia californica TaxID=171875 RepID=UPI0035DE43F6